MRRPLVSVVLTALVAGLLVAVAGSPAHARSTRVDPADSPRQYDTRRIALYPNFQRYVVVQAYSSMYRVGPKFNGIEISYDTRGGPAADYRLVWSFRKDGDGYDLFTVLRVNGSDTVSTVSCPGARGKGRRRISAIEISVPRSCLAINKRVGVRVTTWDYTRYRNGRPVKGFRDNAPNRGFLR